MLASIIIDNYNYGKFLGDAIDSALAQSYIPVEIIVVDDGSTDNSREIINNYGKKVVALFKNNGGQASAFNAGFDKCNGDVIFFLDSDDILFPGAVKAAVQFFLSDTHTTKVHWPLWMVDENGQKTGEMKPSSILPQGNYRDVVLAGGPTSCISSPTSGNAWARHFLEKIFPVPEDVAYYKTCADEYLYTLAPVFGEIKSIAEPQGFYRIHGKNIYSSLSFEEKLKLELRGHSEQTKALSTILRKHDIHLDESKWKRYSWFHLLERAIQDIERLIPHRDVFILVDDEAWAPKESFPNYQVLPFLECNGVYGGAPADDVTGIKELLRLQEMGAKFIVFARQSFWWLQFYPKFNNYVRLNFPCIIENDSLIIFNLNPGS